MAMTNERLAHLLRQVEDAGPNSGPYVLPAHIQLTNDELSELSWYLDNREFMGVTFAAGLNEKGRAKLAELESHK